MPARWIDLLERLELVAALAKRDLGSHDYELFSARAIQSLVSKRYKDDGQRLKHPLPNGEPLHSRDPSADSSASG